MQVTSKTIIGILVFGIAGSLLLCFAGQQFTVTAGIVGFGMGAIGAVIGGIVMNLLAKKPRL